MSNKEKLSNWYQNEITKDNQDLDREKNDFIKKLKSIKKENLFKEKIEKPTLWVRLKKALMGI